MRSPKAWCSTFATLAPTSMPTSSSSASGPTGKPNDGQRAVDVLDGRALLEQARRLVHVRRERARRVEARPVAHHDHVLAQAPPERHRGRGGPGVRLRGDDDLEQRHLLRPARRSACRARAAGRRASRAISPIGQRRGVAREHAARPGSAPPSPPAPCASAPGPRRPPRSRGRPGGSRSARVVDRQPVHALADARAGRGCPASGAPRTRRTRAAARARAPPATRPSAARGTPASAADAAMPAPMRPAPTTPSFSTSSRPSLPDSPRPS